MLRRVLIIAVVVMLSSAVAAQAQGGGLVSDADGSEILSDRCVFRSDASVLLAAYTTSEMEQLGLGCGPVIVGAITTGICAATCIETFGAGCLLCVVGVGMIAWGEVNCSNTICRVGTYGNQPFYYWDKGECCQEGGSNCVKEIRGWAALDRGPVERVAEAVREPDDLLETAEGMGGERDLASPLAGLFERAQRPAEAPLE